MTEIQLGYGRDSLGFTFDENRYQILEETSLHEQPLTGRRDWRSFGCANQVTRS